MLGESDKAHHELKEPHYYLALLGTDPLYQRTGAGSAALQPVLERCDAEGVSAYLETQKEENLAYYARHRFELARKLEVKGAPAALDDGAQSPLTSVTIVHGSTSVSFDDVATNFWSWRRLRTS